MEEQSSQKGFGRIFQFAALLFILVIAPAMSWYYLRSGVDYRKTTLSELKDYGAFNFFDWKLVNRPKYAIADSIKDKIVIVNIVNNNEQDANNSTDVMNKIFDQFKERPDVLFATFLTTSDSIAAREYAKKNNPKNYTNYWFSTVSTDDYPKLLEGLKLNQKGDFSHSSCPYITYINAQGIVSNFYDINDKVQLGRLIEHIAMRLKIDKFDTPEIIREKEK